MIYKLLKNIQNELNLKNLYIKHEISEEDKDVDILISKNEFNSIKFPSNYKLIYSHPFNNHCIYIRFDTISYSFKKIDFILDALDYCNIINIPLEKLRYSSRKITDGIYVLSDEYIYLDRYLGYMFFAWKKKRTLSYLKKNKAPSIFLINELSQFNINPGDINNPKKIKYILIRKKLLSYMIYIMKKKTFNFMYFKNKIIVVFIGIDGAGKTTIIKQLEKELSYVFNVKSVYMGRRDFSLWPIKIFRYFKYKVIKVKRGSNSIKKTGVIENIMIFIELYWRYLKSLLDMNSELILFDRYFYDTIIHSKNHLIESLLISLTPKPQLLIFLDAPDHILFTRKKEINIEKIKSTKSLFFSKKYIKPIVINTYENDVHNCIRLIKTHIYQSLT